MTKIVAAAIRIKISKKFKDMGYPDYMIVSSPPPARHHSLMHPMFDITGVPLGPQDQGFLTSEGTYVSREEAMELVVKNKQPIMDEHFIRPDVLFSEDLW